MKRRRHSFLLSIIVVMFVFFCVMTIIKLEIEINKQTDTNEALSEEIENLKYDNDELRNDLEAPKDDEYYEKKAREKLNRRLPEEIIFYNDLQN